MAPGKPEKMSWLFPSGDADGAPSLLTSENRFEAILLCGHDHHSGLGWAQ